jgi:hypothetical protein
MAATQVDIMNVLWLRQDAIDRRNEAAARFPAHFTLTRISAESAFIFPWT